VGVTKIMVIRHTEKLGNYNKRHYPSLSVVGEHDNESLVTIGWKRAGALAEKFNVIFEPSFAKKEICEDGQSCIDL
jgi:hypothetical protein